MTTKFNCRLQSFGLLLCFIITVDAVRVQQPQQQQQAKITKGE